MTNLPSSEPNAVPVPESVSKERELSPVSRAFSEKTPVPVVEVNRVPELQAEREGLLKRENKDNWELENPVKDESGQVLVSSPAPQSPKIILPVTQNTYLDPENWHLPFSSALKWVLEWSKKIAKIYPGRTMFRN